ncbi:Rieske 2Fe-2S domain-containing protein [Tepidiforma sp.]|uniref:Rieske (2Fe-2S) protein n=1 Tax=Tepidiforma sp. TaxID=2682230 RepID=UPI002ADE33D5|nr:Rieske 2Fe-2S domain-containing protein [Tepidiforma sp.]
MSPALAFLGVSILGTWGIASIGLIAGGIILLFFPGDPVTASDNTLGGIVLLVAGLVSGGLMQVVVAPLLGLDAPVPIRAREIRPHTEMTRWARVGLLRELPDGMPKEVRARAQRVVLVRTGDNVHALNALCSHARLPLAGFPGSPIRPEPVRDNCVMCPFHGARFDISTGKVVRQPFSSQFNNEHPFLGGIQSKIFKLLRFIPMPYQAFPVPRFARPTLTAEDLQTYPVKVENGEVYVGLPR